ncbi:hypothetical protein L3X38_003213 [Prunus dulcis]|uniref:Uncharacterized protein n=1 Tax=Prunus dulcis TaxID=3755 RepID=A0AAD4ZLM9_PRUDU|nr:hypothetical protein L3X38_003213 [Prunus dulcis]
MDEVYLIHWVWTAEKAARRRRYTGLNQSRLPAGFEGVNHVFISREEQRPDEWDVGFGLDLNASVEEQVQVVEKGDLWSLSQEKILIGGISGA